MTTDNMELLLNVLHKTGLSPEEALELLNARLTHHLGFAVVDGGRGIRSALPEIVLASGKSTEEILDVTDSLLSSTGLAIVSRLEPEFSGRVLERFPDGEYHVRARMFVAGDYRGGPGPGEGSVALVSAGTSDLHAAEEAAVVLEVMKADIRRIYDIGVAGLHRLSETLPVIRAASVCLVFAGMDAALPTVLGGLYRGPVVAVPTSTGYGTAFGGVTALLSMLNSCSPGICVMNIDNGLGAAAAALRMIRSPE
ncbi:MAG: nickel pincer cofactor biosynthesis protein LarB [Candidatus Fermentibacteraceae bacterium]|nr:nickel pincer cofactor biosynthesis protein LarB [Candidatus Fermentibacteraceae bacterium]